jgi:hypothetical protein
MFRLLARVVTVSLACGISPSGAETICRVEVTACNIACPDPGSTKTTCARKCHTVLCARYPKRLAKSQMPSSELPADELPRSQMPNARLPDSRLY